ncbi:50S ribosomal protein L3 [uncultured bacterium]|nr:50S ribosomal protein L3 [uncultured bacterium]
MNKHYKRSLRLLVYKKFCTSIIKNNKLHIATICQSDKISVLKHAVNNKIHTFILGFFSIENINKYNKSLINGMYQKDMPIKKKMFRNSNIVYNDSNKNIIEFLIDKFNKKEEFELKDIISMFDLCNISGKAKGRGFAGGMKRHGFSGLNKTHGVTLKHRCPCSTGSRNPNHTIKGKKMAGRFCNKVYIKGLNIIKNNDIADKNILVLSGSIPGSNNSLIEVIL